MGSFFALCFFSLCSSALTLNVPATSAGSYTVSWSNGTAPYTLFENFNGTVTAVYGGSGSSISFSGKASGTYTYSLTDSSVNCFDGGYFLGTICYPAFVTVETVIQVIPIPGVPASITTPSTDNDGTYTVSWGAATGTVASYQLFQQKNGGSWSNIYTGSGLSKSIASNLDGSYRYQVKACNSSGCSAYRVSNTTLVANKPGVPSSLTLPTTDSDGSVSVSWGLASGNVTRYELQYKKDSNNWLTIYSGGGEQY